MTKKILKTIKKGTEEITSCVNCPFVTRNGNLDNDIEWYTYRCEAPGFGANMTDEEDKEYDDNEGFYSTHDDHDNKGFDVYESIHPHCPLDMTNTKIFVLYAFGGDVESLIGVFDDEAIMKQKMEENLATWHLEEGETVGEPRDVPRHNKTSDLFRTIYPIMVDGKEYHNGSCFSVEKLTLNEVR